MLGAQVRFDEALAPKTSIKIGGPAAAYAEIGDAPTLARLLRYCRDEALAWTVLGMGSNLLVRDDGFDGVVVRLTGAFVQIAVEGARIRAGGAAPMVALCREAARHGLSGAEGLVGIPGSVGGSVRMNAGTDVEIGPLLRSIDIVIAGEDPRSIAPPAFAYRSSALTRGAVVCAAEVELAPGDRAAVQAEYKRRLERRNATQPVEQPSFGSTFRNPPGDFAARLIESAGLKGLRVGGAMISDKHANFVVNAGGATCADVLALVERVRESVRRTHGVELELEVHVL